LGHESVTRGTWLAISPGFLVIPIGTMIIAIVLLVARIWGDGNTPGWLVGGSRNHAAPAVRYHLLPEDGDSI
jgi:hypothetical protein